MSLGQPSDLERLAAAIADALCGLPDSPVKGNPQAAARVVVDAIRDNFRMEEEVNREAERAFAALGSSAAGMDREKLMAGLRERIAKKKGFVL